MQRINNKIRYVRHTANNSYNQAGHAVSEHYCITCDCLKAVEFKCIGLKTLDARRMLGR